MARPQTDRQACDDAQADALLKGLVERYSPSGEEGKAVEYLVAEMQSLGFRATVDGAGNAVGKWGNGNRSRLGDGDRTILLLGHIDTVPGFIDVRQEGNLLYGRGAVDAKGALATFVAAASRVDPQPGKHIVVVGAVEEEAATSRGARFLLRQTWPDAETAPAAVVIGEPSAWDRITVGYKGRLLVEYTLAGEIGHTAGPGKSACEKAVDFWQQVVDHAARWNGGREHMFEQLTPSLRQIRSEDDGFTEQVSMTIGYRLPPGIDIDALQGALTAYAGDAQLRFRGREIAFRAPKNTPLARAFIKAIRAEGGCPLFKVKSGTSDMNVVGPAWGCPILAYGPGDSALDHTPHEHIDLGEYHRAIAVLTRVLADL
jgi:LysW-gamma-L-lysine carboxypeptidase